MGLFDWMFGTTPEAKKPVEVKEKSKPKVIDIRAWINLDNGLFSIERFGFDGYHVPNIDSPYHADRYLNDWLISRHIGDGYNIEPTKFLQACLKTKTSSSKVYCGYEIKVTIMNDPQTHTKQN